MAVQASNNERDFTSHLDGSGSLRIVNRELVNQIKTRNQRIMDLEDKVEALEISLRERKEQSAAEVLGEFLNIEVVSEEDLSNMETETDTTDLQDTSSETGDNPVEAETEASDADDREKLKTTSVVVTAAIRKEGLEDGQTIRYDVLRTVVVGTNPVVSQEIKTFLKEALEDLRELILELEEVQTRDESRVAERNDTDEVNEPGQTDSTVLLGQSLEEFNTAVAEIPKPHKTWSLMGL